MNNDKEIGSHMKKKIDKSRLLFAISLALIVMQYAILLGRYAHLGTLIPIFVDIRGNVLQAIPKTMLAVLRLPTMGAIIFAICAVMTRLPYGNLEAQAQYSNRLLWSGIAFINSVKMSGTVLEMAFSEYREIFRAIAVTMAAAGAVILLLYTLWVLRREEDTLHKTRDAFRKTKKMPIMVLLIAYIVVTAAPVLFGQ